MREFILNIEPFSKPRMVASDKYKKRACVVKYWANKDVFVREVKRTGLPEIKNKITLLEFHIPMPKSWSEKKKLQMNGLLHEQRPDIDNLLKAFQDCLLSEDKCIADVHVRKLWSYNANIRVII